MAGRVINRVLVVDDDELTLAAFVRGDRDDLRILGAHDADEALQIAARERPDLAVVDLRLPHGSGIDLIHELKATRPGLVAVLLSGYLSVELTMAAVRAGAELVLFKPVTLTTILRRLEHPEEEPEETETPTLARAEWEHISRVLADCNGNVSMAARRLGIYRSSLQRRLKKHAPPR